MRKISFMSPIDQLKVKNYLAKDPMIWPFLEMALLKTREIERLCRQILIFEQLSQLSHLPKGQRGEPQNRPKVSGRPRKTFQQAFYELADDPGRRQRLGCNPQRKNDWRARALKRGSFEDVAIAIGLAISIELSFSYEEDPNTFHDTAIDMATIKKMFRDAKRR